VSDSTRSYLETLELAGLLRRAQIEPELEYLFRHALVQEAAYESLLTRQREALHLAVAETIEALYPQRGEELAATLAMHYDRAGRADRAQHYCVQAAESAARRFANREAEAHLAQAIALAEHSPLPEDELIRLYQRRGRLLEILGDYSAARDAYLELLARAEKSDSDRMRLAALIPLTTIHAIYSTLHNPAEAERLGREALALAERLGEPRALSKANWNLLLTYNFSENYSDRAIEFGQRAIAIAREHGLREELAYALHDSARALGTRGRLEAADSAYEEAREIFIEIGNLAMLTDSYTAQCEVQFFRGDYEKTVELGSTALDLSRRTANAWGQIYSLGSVAPALMEMGQVDEAIADFQQAVGMGMEASFAGAHFLANAYLAFYYNRLGLYDEARKLADGVLDASLQEMSAFRVFPLAIKLLAELHLSPALRTDDIPDLLAQTMEKEILFDPTFLPVRTLIVTDALVLLGQPEQALEVSEKMIAAQSASGGRAMIPEVRVQRARALVRLGRLEEAREELQAAAEEGERQKARLSLAKVYGARRLLARQTGDAALAAEAENKGRDVLAFILGHMQAPEHRAALLALPELEGLGLE
jgi:tetratricopeptide (TPR) repeat protein